MPSNVGRERPPRDGVVRVTLHVALARNSKKLVLANKPLGSWSSMSTVCAPLNTTFRIAPGCRQRRGALKDRRTWTGGFDDEVRELLRKLRRKVWSCLPPILAVAVLSQSVQGRFPCPDGGGQGAYEKV